MFEKLKIVCGLTIIPVFSVFAGAMLSTEDALSANTHIPLGVLITAISVTAGIAYAATRAWDSLLCRIKSLENSLNQLYCVKNAQCLRGEEEKKCKS